MSKQIEYIDTGVNWLGKIPSTWESKRIKMLTRVKRGASPRPIDNPIYFDEEGVFAWVRIADVTASERYLESTTQRLSELGSSLSVKRYPDDFFLSIAGTVGKPIITKIKCCIHDGFVYFPDLKINPEFLYYIFSTGLPYLGLGKMGTQLNLNTDTVGDIYIPIPDEKEIEKIVNYLDVRTAEIDSLISKKQKLIDCLKEERKAIIDNAVTQGIKAGVSLKATGNDLIEKIPEHWKIKRLKHIGQITSGAAFPSTAFQKDGNVKVIKITNVQHDYIDFSDIEFLPDEYLDQYSKFQLKTGDIVFALTRPIISSGIKSAIIYLNDNDAFLLNQRNAFFRSFEGFSNRFVYYITHCRYFYQLFEISMDTTGQQPNISPVDISNFQIVIPDLEEQNEIVQFLDEKTSEISNAINKVEQEIELIKEYRTSLINEVVTGKITLN